MILVVFQHALKDFFRFKRLWPWLLLSGITYLIGFAWGRFTPDAAAVDQYGTVSGLLILRILPLASAIYTTAVVSQEVEQKTIVYLLTRTIPRATLLLGRYLASVVVVAAVTALAAVALSLATFQGSFLSNHLLVNDLMAIAVGAFAYGALFLFVSLLFNRAMLICLLYAFGWETSVPNLPGSMSHLALVSYVQSLANHSANRSTPLALLSSELRTGEISRLSAVLTLLGVTLVGLLASAYWFTTFEFVPREDAE